MESKSPQDDDYKDWLSDQIWHEAYEHYLAEGYSEYEAEDAANRSVDYFLNHGG